MFGVFLPIFFSFSENSGVFVAGQSFSGEEYVCLLGTALGRRAFCKRPPSVNDVLLNHPIIALGMWEVASCLCSSCSLCSLGLLGAYLRSCTVGSGFSVSPAWTKKGRPLWSSCCLSLLFQVQKKKLLRLPISSAGFYELLCSALNTSECTVGFWRQNFIVKLFIVYHGASTTCLLEMRFLPVWLELCWYSLTIGWKIKVVGKTF